MDKAPDAYRTISEVGEDLDLPQHVLRFWETRFPQIKPLKRGGGRRYYRPDDVELLKGIRHLLYKEGYTIKGVQRILKEQGARAVMAWASPAEAEAPEPMPAPPAAFLPPSAPAYVAPPAAPAYVAPPPPVFMAPPAPSAPVFAPVAAPEPVFVAPVVVAAPEPVLPEPVLPEPVLQAPPSFEPGPRDTLMPLYEPQPLPAPSPMAGGQVSMFRGGLVPGAVTAEGAPAGFVLPPLLPPGPPPEQARVLLQQALDELVVARATLDQCLAARLVA